MQEKTFSSYFIQLLDPKCLKSEKHHTIQQAKVEKLCYQTHEKVLSVMQFTELVKGKTSNEKTAASTAQASVCLYDLYQNIIHMTFHAIYQMFQCVVARN